LIHEIELVKVRHLHPGIGISAFICVSKPGLGGKRLLWKEKQQASKLLSSPDSFIIACYAISELKGFIHHPFLTKKSEPLTHILLLLIHAS